MNAPPRRSRHRLDARTQAPRSGRIQDGEARLVQRAHGRASPIGAGASHRLAHLHPAELPKKISRSPLDDPVSGSITRKSIIRRDQPGLTLVERNVSLNRFVEFGEITETPFGLRGNSASFPVLDRSLGHTDGDCELRLCQPKGGTQGFDVDSNIASSTAWDRPRSRTQIKGTSHVRRAKTELRSIRQCPLRCACQSTTRVRIYSARHDAGRSRGPFHSTPDFAISTMASTPVTMTTSHWPKGRRPRPKPSCASALVAPMTPLMMAMAVPAAINVPPRTTVDAIDARLTLHP